MTKPPVKLRTKPRTRRNLGRLSAPQVQCFHLTGPSTSTTLQGSRGLPLGLKLPRQDRQGSLVCQGLCQVSRAVVAHASGIDSWGSEKTYSRRAPTRQTTPWSKKSIDKSRQVKSEAISLTPLITEWQLLDHQAMVTFIRTFTTTFKALIKPYYYFQKSKQPNSLSMCVIKKELLEKPYDASENWNWNWKHF